MLLCTGSNADAAYTLLVRGFPMPISNVKYPVVSRARMYGQTPRPDALTDLCCDIVRVEYVGGPRRTHTDFTVTRLEIAVSYI